MKIWHAVALVFGLAAFLAAIVMLERPRIGLEITHHVVDQTPVTVMRLPNSEGPVVILAHGFAGSRQLMSAYQINLAQAGYITASFDFEGHGRRPQAMRGDVTEIDGTTRLLMEQLGRVTDWVANLRGSDGRIALLGHSMASDIVLRQGLVDERVETIIALSLYSEAVTENAPQSLLIINGQWEGSLRTEARRIMAEAGVVEGVTVGDPATAFARRAAVAPWVEHVGILYSPTGIAEAQDWLDRSFAVNSPERRPVALGGWIVLALASVVLIAWPIAQLLPSGQEPFALPASVFWILALVPAALTPIILTGVRIEFLSVLVADYLALHLGVYGALVLFGLLMAGAFPSRKRWWAGVLLALFGLTLFGGLLDRYVANFFPSGDRMIVFAAILPGSIFAMVAEASLLQGGAANWVRRLGVRIAFLASLGVAVALDFERLMFLLIILPVIVVFHFSFSVMGSFAGRRTGSALAMGIGLGVILAWALAATFPLFQGTL